MTDPRHIGKVQQVLGATIVVELDDDLAGVAPIVAGRLQPVGQLGSLVRLPQGPVDLVAAVVLLGIAEGVVPTPGSTETPAVPKRWLQAQLLGEVLSSGQFRRGVSTYPTLGDPVMLVLDRELESVFPPPGDGRVRLGRLSAARGAVVSLDVPSLVMRHGAIVGSTGSGKSTCVALLIQRMATEWPGANIVVVDPHGEYAAALMASASVMSVQNDHPTRRLQVPYWALPAQDLLRMIGFPVEGGNTQARFAELVVEARRAFAASAEWEVPNAADISPDSPIPFDLRDVWFRLDAENHATQETVDGELRLAIAEPGDGASLTSTRFRAYGQGGRPPNKGPNYDAYRTTPDRMRNRLRDPRLAFFLEPVPPEATAHDPLPGLVQRWLGDEKAVAVLDFSGVPTEAADLAIGLVLRLLFEVAVRGRDDGIGRARPVFIVLEEAHRYLGGDALATRMARDSANRIAREGRKHGVGLLLVTQRPSELPATALAQVGTILAMRLTNASDQSCVKASLPDNLAGLAEALPSLRTGEVIVSGEGVVLPARVLVDLAEPPPRASDPALTGWTGAPMPNDVSAPIARWRNEEAG